MSVYVRARHSARRSVSESDHRLSAAGAGETAVVSPAIELRGVHKSFGGVRAVRGVDLALAGGEIHALVGENGAGKSTLVRMIGGVHQPDEGEVVVGGETVVLHSPADARARGVAVIYQEPALFPDLDIAENIYMGRQPRGRLGIDWREMYREVDELIASLGVNLEAKTPVQGLSVADQQLVEIAKALSLDAQVVVMDEPTAALSSRETEQLFRIVRELRERGVAVLFISHRLEEVFELADTVTVLRDGEHVITSAAAELDTTALIRHMVGRELGELFPKEEAEIGAPLLEVRGLTRQGVFHDVSLTVRRGPLRAARPLGGAGPARAPPGRRA